MTHLTSISSASLYRVSDFLPSSVSLTQCTPQDNNDITENRPQMMKENISSLGENFKYFYRSSENIKGKGKE